MKILLLSLLLASCGSSRGEVALHDGDIVFQTSKSSQSLAVQRATRSRYSHMGMVVFRDGRPFVFEASATVRLTPLGEWTARGEGGHYVVKRLRKSDQLSLASHAKAQEFIRKWLGKNYDLTFEWSDDRAYCSELVWKLYEEVLGIRLGELQKLGEFNLGDHAVQTKLRERYGTKVPLDEPVISPAAMFDSRLLATVVER